MAKNVLIVDGCDATRRILMCGVRQALGSALDLAAALDGSERSSVHATPTFDLILSDLSAVDANATNQRPAPAAKFRPFLK